MSQRVLRAPEAELDLAEIADYLARISPRTALRFLDAAEAAFARLADFPEIGARFESENQRLDGLRVWQVPHFPKFLIFYRLSALAVEVVRVVHGMRDLENLPVH